MRRQKRVHQFICNNCKKLTTKTINRIKDKFSFCSSLCYGAFIHSHSSKDDAQRIMSSSSIYPTKKYKLVSTGERNPSGKIIYRMEHRLIVEKNIGRKLLKTEHIHHIDGNGLNNEISNLQVLSSSDHAKFTINKMHTEAKRHYKKHAPEIIYIN